MMRGIYPGSFNPPTLGHMAIAEAAIATYNLTSLELAISARPLGKSAVRRPTLEHRRKVVELSVAHLDGARVTVSELRFIADLAEGYDVVVMGADKWQQVNDVAFYDSPAERDASLARLPALAIAKRGNAQIPPGAELTLSGDYGHISSSAAREGAHHFMTPAAREFDRETGGWSDAREYDAYLAAEAER